MSFKKLSLILLTALCFNAYSMEEQKNEEPIEQKQKKLSNPKKAKILKQICAEELLKNKMAEEVSGILPEELQDYLEYINNYNQKLQELENHSLAPVFKKYLIKCLDNLPIDVLQQTLDIVDKAYEKSPEKCLFLQSMLPSNTKTLFSDSPLINLTTTLIQLFPVPYAESSSKIFETIKDFYTKKSEIENLPIIEFNLLMLNTMNFNENTNIFETDCFKQLTTLADKVHTPSIFTIAKFKISDNKRISEAIEDIEKLIEMNALDYAGELIITLIGLQKPPFGIAVPKEIFHNAIQKFIAIIDNKENQSDYYLILALIYEYLDNKILAKKYAKRFYNNNNKEIFFPSIHMSLSNFYSQKGKNEKAEAHLKMINKYKDLRFS